MIDLILNLIKDLAPYLIWTIIVKELIQIKRYTALISYSNYNIQKNTFKRK
jgi:hypothetical protein